MYTMSLLIEEIVHFSHCEGITWILFYIKNYLQLVRNKKAGWIWAQQYVHMYYTVRTKYMCYSMWEFKWLQD